MKVRIKLILLLVFCMISFASLILVHVSIMEGRLRDVFNEEEKAWITSIDKQLSLVGESLKECVYDYAFWNEMVSFLKAPDKSWGKEGINASLQTYKASCAWVYRKDFTLHYAANAAGDCCFDKLPVPEASISRLFSGGQFCHFFIKSPKGIMEIRGATVYPSFEASGKSEPEGYFFAGRLWDDIYLSDLSLLTDARVTVSLAGSAGPAVYESDPKAGLIAYGMSLKDWEGVTLARLNILRSSAVVKDLVKLSGQTVFILVLYSVVLFIILWFCLAYWISNPLWLLSRSFVEKRPVIDRDLLRQKDEFGEMAALMNRFFAQRERLVTEITEHKHSVHALRTSEVKYRDLYNSIRDGIVRVEMDGRIVECNRSFQRMLGYTEAELTEKTCQELTPPRWHGVEADIVAGQVMTTGYSKPYEKEFVKKDGAAFPVSLITWLIRDERGEPSGMWSTVTDMAEQYKAEQDLDTAHRQLVQSEKMAALGRFASGVAHEVKNPLAILLGGLEYLKDRLSGPDAEVREAIGKMREAVIRADTIVKDLLAFAKPSKLAYEKMDANLIVRDAVAFVDLLRIKSSKSKVVIKQALYGGELPVEADKNQMQQALFNILLNAIEAIPENGEIAVRTYPQAAGAAEAGLCVIEVQDTGIGIGKQDIVKLFEPFFTTKRGHKGTGLGLAIVKSIVEKHKGTITIDSELGEGTTVRVMLPLAA